MIDERNPFASSIIIGRSLSSLTRHDLESLILRGMEELDQRKQTITKLKQRNTELLAEFCRAKQSQKDAAQISRKPLSSAAEGARRRFVGLEQQFSLLLGDIEKVTKETERLTKEKERLKERLESQKVRRTKVTGKETAAV